MRGNGRLRKTLSAALALVFLLTLLPVEARAADILSTGNCGAEGNNLRWTLDSNGVLVISGVGEMAGYDARFGWEDTSPPWYGKRQSITSVVICEGVSSIGNDAFRDCINLQFVSIPSGVMAIYSCAFMHCESLLSVTIPNTVTYIGMNAFSHCVSLTEIELPDSITYMDSTFANCTGLTHAYLSGSYIGAFCFSGCTNLQSVEFSTLPEAIYRGAFKNCTSLKELVIPENITLIDESAFENCNSLTTLFIPVTTQGKSTSFSGCSALSYVRLTCNNSAEGETLTRLGGGGAWHSAETVELSDGITSIGEAACAYCRFASMILPDSIKTIGERAFDNCSLESIILPDSIETIGDLAFNGCKNLSEIELPSSLKSIGYRAFASCTLLSDIRIPSSVTSFSPGAFANCTALTEIRVDSGNPNYSSVDGVLFSKDLSQIVQFPSGRGGHYTIPNSVREISNAFIGSKYLTEVTLPSGYYSGSVFNSNSFDGCTSIQSFLIDPGAKRYISVDGIIFTENMDRLLLYPIGRAGPYVIPDTVSYFGEAFRNSVGLTQLIVPDGVTTLFSYAFDGCSSLESIQLPSSLTKVGYSVFSTYGKLDTVYFNGSKSQWDAIDFDSGNNAILNATVFYACESNNGGGENLRLENCVSVLFDSTMNGKRSVTGLTYDDAWFTQNSYVYNHELATMTLGLAMSAFERKEDGKPYSADGTDNVKSLFVELDFLPRTFAFYNYHDEDNGTVGIAMATKTIYDSNGSPVPLLAVALRGGGYGNGGWAGNFEVGDSSKYHDGFYKAADNTAKIIREYIDAKGIDRSKLRVWLTGYSRSAATANLVSQLLSIRGTCMRENIYTYTFATPSNQLIAGFSDSYNNIFNILNPIDIVTMIPPLQWNFGKQGTSIYTLSPFPNYYSGSQGAIATLFSDFQSLFCSISGCEAYNYADCQPLLIETLFDSLMDAFSDRRKFYLYLQDPMVQFEWGDYSAIDEEILCGITSVEELKELFKLGKDNAQKAMLNFTSPVMYDMYIGLAALNYAKMVSKLANVISYRDKAFGPSDPYLKIVETLWKLLKQKAGELACHLIGSTSGTSDADFVFDILSRAFESDALMQHFPEVYMAWMMTCEEGNMAETSTYKTRVATVKCPVNVEVYDEEGNLVARTRTETYTVEDEDTGEVYTGTFNVLDSEVTTLDAVIFGDSKYFALPDDHTYRIEIVTNESFELGDSMSYTVTDYIGGTANASVSYEDIQLTEGSSFEASVMTGDVQMGNCTISDGTQALAPTGLMLPADTVRIEAGAFENYSSLSELTIPASVEEIAGNAFKGCSNLKKATFLPKSCLTSIGDYAFSGCSSITAVTVPAGVTSIGDFAFEGCVGIADVYFGGTEEQWNMITVGAGNEHLTDAAIHFGAWAITWKNDDGIIIDTTTVEDGILPTYDVPAKPTDNEYEYHFIGWDPEITVATKDVVYTAQFSATRRQYVVSFDTNSGTGTMGPQRVLANIPTALNPNAFTRDGYTFTGWNTAADGSGTAYADGAEVTLTADLTLYAQWKRVLAVTDLTADQTTVETGVPITWTVTAEGGTGTLQYCFDIYRDGEKIREGVSGTENTASFTPTETGTYTATVYVEDEAGNTANLNGGAVTVSAAAEPLTVTDLTADQTTVETGVPITWTVTAEGGTGTLQYRFDIYRDGEKIREGVSGTENTASFTPTEPGAYSATVYVEDEAGNTANLTGGAITVSAAAEPLTVTDLTADQTTVETGMPITWTVTAEGGTGTLQYRFDIYRDGEKIREGVSGTENTASFTPTEPGTYTATVYVEDEAGNTANLTGGAVTVSAAAEPLTVTDLVANQTTVETGVPITWTVIATGGSGALTYRFDIYRDGEKIQEGVSGKENAASYTPAEPGTYTATVYVEDEAENKASLTGGAVTVSAAAEPLTVTDLVANQTTIETGVPITWTVTAEGGTGTLQYRFYLYKDGEQFYKGTYGAANTISYTPTEPGVYTARGYAKDEDGNVVSKPGAGVIVKDPDNALKITAIIPNKTSANVGDAVTWTAAAAGGSGTYKYRFYLYRDGEVLQKGIYGTASMISYTPTEPGVYTVRVYVKDANGSVSLTGGDVAVVPPAPTGVKLASSLEGITVSWSKATGAAQYRVVRTVDGVTTKVKVTGTSYTDTTVEKDKTYTYSVQAISSGGTYSEASESKNLYYPLGIAVKVKGTKANVSWTAVTGATKYQVYRRPQVNGKYGDWVLIYSAKGTSYVDNPGAGTWQYRVRAVVDGTKTPYSNRKRVTIG